MRALVLACGLVALWGCEGLTLHDTQSLLAPRFTRSEFLGFVAGAGTTFAAFPDLVAMVRRRSSAGINPRMAAIMGAFQVLWVYYGLLIGSRPVIVWNVLAVLINFLNVAAWTFFSRREGKAH
jgi:uncharacterized protein with PQ loop repeat